MKTLNVIQSRVFDVAYYSNENMLISAPTGAGKTNIAMLAVLREIQNNLENGVLKKDQFKVNSLIMLCYEVSSSANLFLGNICGSYESFGS